MRPDSTKVFTNKESTRTVLGESFKFLPEYFKMYGYHTEKYGKFTCNHEEQVKWDYNSPIDRNPSDGLEQQPQWWIDTVPRREEETVGGTLTALMTERMKIPVSEPYFYSLGLQTHNPFTPLISSWNKTGNKNAKEILPVDIDGTKTNVQGNKSINIKLPDTPTGDTLDIPSIALKKPLTYSTDEWKRIRHAYYGEIIEADYHLGMLLDSMDRNNLWDNSIVVFWSDHGLQLGEHEGQWLKLTLFEESLRVPFIICAPGKKAGICERPVELVDIFPTLTELCGLPHAANQQGSSLVWLLDHPEAIWKKAIFSQVQRNSAGTNLMGRAVRTETFHYNSWESLGEEMYDIINDPYEYTNLVSDTRYKDTLAKMRDLLKGGWQKAMPPSYITRTFFRDADNDGYGVAADSVLAIEKPDNYALAKGDCDDNDPLVNPGSPERGCNGKDDNCNGQVDETNPVAKITFEGSLDVCNNSHVLLTANNGQGITYQWVNNDVVTGDTSKTFTPKIIGSYQLKVTDSTGCSTLSNPVQVVSSCFTSRHQTIVYPNPSNGKITVKYVTDTASHINISIYNFAGKTIINNLKQTVFGSNYFNFDLSRFGGGTYYLKIDSGNKIKFLILKR